MLLNDLAFLPDGFEDLSPEMLADILSDDEILNLLEIRDNELWSSKYELFKHLFPAETYRVGNFIAWARHLYPQHMLFFRLGAEIRFRCFMAANRVGKTFSGGGYELTCHLTGLYPDWWEGRRFHHPIRAWACGKTNETTRDIIQVTLLGEVTYQGARKSVDGSGIIPIECIGADPGQLTWKQGVADLIDTVKIKHVTGQWSTLGLKSYKQGRGAFEGTAQHVIWDDEEPPMDVYNEQAIRLATTKGLMMLTFTPLEGMSDVVQNYMPDDEEVFG
jgi:phage terminase large subunit-like protein